jgi:dolichol kinase
MPDLSRLVYRIASADCFSLLQSKHIQLMTAGIVHVTNLTPPGASATLLVGRRLGAGNKLWFNKNKSAAGSAAMFIGGFGLSLVGLYNLNPV